MSRITDPQELRKRHQAFLASQLETIEKYGNSVIAVFGDPGNPGFAYTIGMSANDPPLPEFLVIGLPPKTAQSLLNELCAKAREKPLGRGYYDDVFAGYRAALVCCRAHAADEYIVQALNLFGPNINVFQLVWPDPSGRFPWDSGYDLDPVLQPILGDPPPKED